MSKPSTSLSTSMARDEIELQPPGSKSHEAISQSEYQGQILGDTAQLLRLGKKPLLSRTFGFMSILGFSCSALVSWEGILVSSVGGFYNGGPAGLVWGLLINWIGALSVSAVLAELASMAPTAGGQCRWLRFLFSFHLSRFTTSVLKLTFDIVQTIGWLW